LMHERSLEVGN